MINLGILGGADIAYRMFLPALLEVPEVRCAAVASRQLDRRMRFEKTFGVPTVTRYEEILDDPSIDAVYLPLPPALHAKWAEQALKKGKHVLLEKPSTTSYADTKRLVSLAREQNLTLQENYMFQYHAQLAAMQQLIADGAVGELRLLRSSFGFPLREANDFRYNRSLGGGALLDAGGYVVKLATYLLGESIRVTSSSTASMDGYEVDMFGTATFENSDGLVFQGAFGMDCHYQCALEAWGSKGKLFTNRIFTAPNGLTPTAVLETAEGSQTISLPSDHHFRNSIQVFLRAIQTPALAEKLANDLLLQAKLIDTIKEN